MMKHFNKLHLILNKYLKWNKSHVKCFTLIMLALIVKQTCNLSSASKALPITCLPQSFHRRIQRFFADQYFDYRQISQFIFNIFLFDKVQLTLDRTNRKWGKRDINILMLAIIYRGIAIPIVWTLLNKPGHVEQISTAAGSEFSVLKPDSPTENFTKVVQRIAVRIAIDPEQKGMKNLRPGMSVITSVDTDS